MLPEALAAVAGAGATALLAAAARRLDEDTLARSRDLLGGSRALG
jgi:hypothetical protein